MDVIDIAISMTSGAKKALLIELKEYDKPINQEDLLYIIKDILAGEITDLSFLTCTRAIDE